MRKNNSQLRIISGELGGRLIDAPNTPATHPMGDRERQAIFNQIRAEVPGAKALDAFAGSGALGIEALSLGAASVDFLENNPHGKLGPPYFSLNKKSPASFKKAGDFIPL